MVNICKQCKQAETASKQNEYCEDCFAYNFLSEPDFDDEIILDETCPNCGHEYDEIDYEYQICHYCKFNNNH